MYVFFSFSTGYEGICLCVDIVFDNDEHGHKKNIERLILNYFFVHAHVVSVPVLHKHVLSSHENSFN